MTDEIKNALAHLDLDKTGRVSTSELVAAAKALEEVRAKNSFMHRVLVVHAVTMLFLLGGMFGLSMTAAELSKETRVSNGGSLVTPGGEPVTVASSELYVGPNGELLQRVSADGRQLEGSEDPQPVTVTEQLPVVDLSEEDDEHGAGRALASLDEVALRLTRGQVDHIVRWSKGMNGRGGCFFLVIQGRGVRRGPAQAYISGSRQFPDGSVIAYGLVGTPSSGMEYKYTWEVQCGTVKLSNGKSKCSVSVESVGSEEPNMEELCFKTGTCKAKVIMRTSSTDADRGRIGNDSGSGNE